MDNVSESILNSVKKLIGIEPSDKSFDVDIILNINAGIFTLNQLGILTKGYSVTSENDTYSDFLGDNISEDVVNQVKMYLVYKTRLGFDPPSSSIVMECVKELAKEAEWRLNASVDPPGAECEEVNSK